MSEQEIWIKNYINLEVLICINVKHAEHTKQLSATIFKPPEGSA